MVMLELEIFGNVGTRDILNGNVGTRDILNGNERINYY